MSILHLLRVLNYSLLIDWVEPTGTTVEMTKDTALEIRNVSVFVDIPSKQLDKVRKETDLVLC